MNIPHIEDLTPEQFLYVLRDIKNFQATEKTDGSNLIFGFDDKGYFYTKRSFKGFSNTYYDESDYPMVVANNGFRIAHKILQASELHFRLIMNAGDAVEVEILYGQQPNTVIYGENTIVFLRVLSGSPELFRQLRREIVGHKVRTTAPAIITKDGVNLEHASYESTWMFTNVPRVSDQIMQRVDLYEDANKFEEWLKANPVASFKNKTEFKKAYLPRVLSIKEKLLEQIVRKVRSPLRTCKVPAEEDFGIEGVVLSNPTLNVSVKLVDKGTFMLINQFNHAIRNQIRHNSWFNKDNYTDLYQTFEATLDGDVSIYDMFLEKVAKELGLEGCDKYMSLTKDLKKFDSLMDFVLRWKVSTSSELKEHLIEIVRTMKQHTEDLCNKFRQEYRDYKLVLLDGRTIKYNQNVYNRTLLVFAELIADFNKLVPQIHASNSLEDIAHALYGQKLNAIT